MILQIVNILQQDTPGIPMGVWILLGVIGVAVILGLIVGSRTREDDSPTVRSSSVDEATPVVGDSRPEAIQPSAIPQTGGPTAVYDTPTPVEAVDRAEGPSHYDDLTTLEGIGPGAQQMLNGAGIYTFQQLADINTNELRSIIQRSGIRTGDPVSWPDQARLAAQGRWDDLKDMQKRMNK